ncbi:MAG: hypothetical protein GF353_20720 [Candidatus Lokiarchaeota archaeon]|nr:hypothetical protein [Candidatus Lokiarchaeota archaeon]
MKEHLVNLLYEQAKQERYFKQIEEVGIEINSAICINNWDIVLDIIGFPKDNTTEYDYDYINSGGEIRDERKRIPDDSIFCRDRFFEKYNEIIQDLSEQNIMVSKSGLYIEEIIDENKVKNNLLEYIEWLYNELQNFEKQK